MTLQAYAESRKTTIAKVKKLCKVVLDIIPQELTEEQIFILDSNLDQSAKALLSGSEDSENSSIEKIPEQQLDKVVEIVGVSTLKKNAMLYHKMLELTLSKTLVETANILKSVENAQASMVSKTYDNMTKNLVAVYKEINVNGLDVSNPSSYLSSLTQADKEWLICELGIMGIPDSEFEDGGEYAA